MQSIIPHNTKGVCYLCGKHTNTDEHHIFGGTANRKLAEADGLKVYLCRTCHETVHSDYTTNVELKRIGEKAWLVYNSKNVEDFIKRYGKNYFW